ncbi:flagellar biosynthesis protein FlhB [Neptunomonas antarctica]|uniref:Flagellar biosynthetic protein FlhB n=1 Tax=Neptunomonas antarctica TaxID=619304 RepID=A0A1N7JCL6_9GAMM|nr:flagellar biosynthesis protein FlhB [Neptunomonas antarctica]SIS47016.1 flagellar biosynthetic protein FlhB [Neptunomonas antarctica]
MAEETGQEKTEDPTPKRLREAREKGDIPRSKELNATALLLAAGGAMLLFGTSAAHRIAAMMAGNFELRREDMLDSRLMLIHLGASVQEVIWAVIGFMVIVTLAALIAPMALGGLNFSAQAMAPKMSRLNPGAGLKRMFSVKALVELAKAFAKFMLVTSFAITVLMVMTPELFALGGQAVNVAISHAAELVGWSFLVISSSLILISLVDVPFQLYDYSEKLKMTLQEVKDEMKNTEGKPEVKGRIRQMQREISQRQMMTDVPQADVVITNPTHYAVALKYISGDRDAPIVVAKGADFVALKIREIAEEHGVPILSTPPLARALYNSTEIDQEVPTALYKAVAQVLAYVFQLKRYKEKQSDMPKQLSERDMIIPEDYRYD